MKKTTPQFEAKATQRRIKGLAVGVVSLALLAGCSANSSGRYLTNTDESRGVMISLARASDELGDYARAADYYAKAIAQGNASEQAWTRRGELLLKLGAVKSAQAHYEAALQAGIDSSDIHRGYGRALARTNQPESALQHFDIALQKAPGSVKAMNGRGVALDMMGRHLEAQAQYAQAQEASPTALSVQNNLALSYTLAGNAHSAIGMLEDIYLSGSSSQQHRQNLALLYGLTGQNDKASALSHMDLRPELVGKNLAAYATLRQNYAGRVDKKDNPQAVASASSTVKSAPSREQTETAFSSVVLPPLDKDVASDPIAVPEAAYVAPQTMARVELPAPSNAITPTVESGVQVSLLPLAVNAPEPVVHVSSAPVTPVAATVVSRTEEPSPIAAEKNELQRQPVQVAGLPLMAVSHTHRPKPASQMNGYGGVNPALQVREVFDNGLAEVITTPAPVSIAARNGPRREHPGPASLSDIELFAMRAELDAFGNPMRILPAGPVKRSGSQAGLNSRSLVPWKAGS